MALDIAQFDLNAIDQDFIENPHPTLARLRAESPVHRNTDGSVFLTRFADCFRVYQSRDALSDKTEAFGKKFGQCPLYDHHTTSLVFTDPPYHTLVRKRIAGAFTPRKLAEFEALITRIVDDLLDRVAEMGTFDLVEDFAKVLPTEIISFMLGVPEPDRARLRDYSIKILGALDPVIPHEKMDAGNRAVSEFSELLDGLINHRRAHPGEGGEGEVLEALIFGTQNGRHLSQQELIQNCIFLLNAGHETTTSMVSNAIGSLLDFPDQLARLRANPDLITLAVEECLRFESPLQIGNRLAAEDIVLQDQTIAKGTYIHTSIAAANRDPDIFEAPDRLDITRKPNRQIAFITGVHVCLGATLARMEGRIALGKFVARFPKLVQAGPRERLPLARFRGYRAFPVQA